MVWFGRHYIAWAQYLPCALVGLCIPYMAYFTQPRLQKAQLKTAKAAAQTTAQGSASSSLDDAVSYTTSYLLAQVSMAGICALGTWRLPYKALRRRDWELWGPS